MTIGLKFKPSLHLHQYVVYVSSKGSGEFAFSAGLLDLSMLGDAKKIKSSYVALFYELTNVYIMYT